MAISAASSAASASAMSAEATEAMTFSVAGLKTSKRWPDAPGRQSPSM